MWHFVGWLAVVGHLFLRDREDLSAGIPSNTPRNEIDSAKFQACRFPGVTSPTQEMKWEICVAEGSCLLKRQVESISTDAQLWGQNSNGGVWRTRTWR